MNRPRDSISLISAVLPLLTLLACLIVGGQYFTVGSEFLIVVLLLAATVAALIAYRSGQNWEIIQAATGQKLAGILPALLILLSIGMLIGTWMFSGTIPVLVFYGVQLVNPTYIVLTTFLATALMSLTGSSWASAGTIGVAMMGVAGSMDASLPMTAGAVISGAYFGDKLSPLSDQTNICAIAARANLYDHIRNMLYTAGPSFVVALLVYAWIGAASDVAAQPNAANGNALTQGIDAAYRIHWLVFLPAAIVIVGTLRRFQAALTMVASSIAALIVGVMLHDFTVTDALSAAISGFNVSMTSVSTSGLADDALTGLLNRGGVYSMSNTIVLVFIAFILAGSMEVSGALDKILTSLLAVVRSIGGLVAATLAAGTAMVSLTSHGGVSALVVGDLFRDAYRERELAPENLSRTLEDSITLLDPLMPWTVAGLFMATTLGVPTLSYAPWAVFCMTGWIFSVGLAAMYPRSGFGLRALQDLPLATEHRHDGEGR